MRDTAVRVLRDPGQAEDVVQEVFLELWRRPGVYDPARGDLQGFLRLMARSRAVDHLRRAQAADRARDRLMATYAPGDPGEAAEPSDVSERRRSREVVRSAVRALPDEQREAIVLHFWGGLTGEQIARRGNMPLGTVKSRLRLGLRKLEHPCAAVA